MEHIAAIQGNCPICKQPHTIQCRCMRSDRECVNGHKWHYCTVHNKRVIGESDHAKPGCSCRTSLFGQTNQLPFTAQQAADGALKGVGYIMLATAGVASGVVGLVLGAVVGHPGKGFLLAGLGVPAVLYMKTNPVTSRYR